MMPGRVLAEAGRNENRADAVLTYKLPQAGKYTLSVTDREKGGSEIIFTASMPARCPTSPTSSRWVCARENQPLFP